jgi:hypothetical protein
MDVEGRNGSRPAFRANLLVIALHPKVEVKFFLSTQVFFDRLLKFPKLVKRGADPLIFVLFIFFGKVILLQIDLPASLLAIAG